jgi:hypothetical protein
VEDYGIKSVKLVVKFWNPTEGNGELKITIAVPSMLSRLALVAHAGYYARKRVGDTSIVTDLEIGD